MPDPTPENPETDDLDEDGEAPEVEGFVVSPRDAASGLPTGKRMHKPFSLGFETDLAPVVPPVPPATPKA